MKKSILTLLMLLSVAGLRAGTFYQQLCAFNPNWQKYADRAPEGEAINLCSDAEMVQAHLGEVLRILRSNPTDHLTAQQQKSRRRMISLLEGYRQRGLFPHNHHYAERTPVFIDEHGTYCAVGYLMQQTGHDEMARRISAREQFDWVKDIQDAGVAAWQPTTGLSVEELKLIQGAYDFYLPDALILTNRFEIPQKPEVGTRYFTAKDADQPLPSTPENIWLKGEGINGVLHGKWVQNYDVGMPWIVGYYDRGKRSGQWMEYYQGTQQLCRTEVWRNDLLNGKRIRYDRSGMIIEEIVFVDGQAITKTNKDYGLGMEYVRKPLDSIRVYTEVYSLKGELLAEGIERIHNPGNLKWFQNIELTALNTMSLGIQAHQEVRHAGSANIGNGRNGEVQLFESPQLVQYKKEGSWTYYRQYAHSAMERTDMLTDIRHHFTQANYDLAAVLILLPTNHRRVAGIDSLCVQYDDNYAMSIVGQGQTDYMSFQVEYFPTDNLENILSLNISQIHTDPYYPWLRRSPFEAYRSIRFCGELDANGRRIGEWKRFNRNMEVVSTVTYTSAWSKEDEDADGMSLLGE